MTVSAAGFDATVKMAVAVANEVQADTSAGRREKALAASVLMLVEERRQGETFHGIIDALGAATDGVVERLETIETEKL